MQYTLVASDEMAKFLRERGWTLEDNPYACATYVSPDGEYCVEVNSNGWVLCAQTAACFNGVGYEWYGWQQEGVTLESLRDELEAREKLLRWQHVAH